VRPSKKKFLQDYHYIVFTSYIALLADFNKIYQLFVITIVKGLIFAATLQVKNFFRTFHNRNIKAGYTGLQFASE